MQVIIILAVVAISVVKSYQKTKKASRPVIDPRPAPVPEAPLPDIQPVEAAPADEVRHYATDELPPIPPLARKMAGESQAAAMADEKEGTKKEEEEKHPATLLGMDIRQAVIAAEILNRKY